MASVLSLPSNKKITKKFLKESGFTQITWGAPKKVTYNAHKRPTLEFDKSQYCWEFFDANNMFDDYFKALIYYFPKGFDAYVAPFQGDWKNKNPKHPENYAYITIDNYDDKWEDIVYIESEDDIKVAFEIAKKRIKYLNRSF